MRYKWFGTGDIPEQISSAVMSDFFLPVIQHLCRVICHKWFVIVAGWRVGVPFLTTLVHDLSKVMPPEIIAYTRQFFMDEKDRDEWAYAWLHHQNSNKHHWNYYIDRGYPDKCLKMPDKYAKEMIADWMATSRAYSGIWDITDWLKKNWDKIRLHEDTRCYVRNVLKRLGYDMSKILSSD